MTDETKMPGKAKAIEPKTMKITVPKEMSAEPEGIVFPAGTYEAPRDRALLAIKREIATEG